MPRSRTTSPVPSGWAPAVRSPSMPMATGATLVIDRVLPRRGVAGFWLGPEQEARNVLVSPDTFDLIRAGGSGGHPPTWRIAVSNRGGVEHGAQLTDEVSTRIRTAAVASGIDAQIYPVKRSTLDVAEAVGKGFASMFTAMGSFGVIAGLLLLVNLFVMLAAERKTELGMARAVGMRRAELVGAFATEGWLYALAATALGVAAGIGLGAVLVSLSARIFATEHNRFDLYFTLKPQSLAQSFAIAFVVALATVVGTSLRVSRLNIIRAIRDVAEPRRAGAARDGSSRAAWSALPASCSRSKARARATASRSCSARASSSSGSRRSVRVSCAPRPAHSAGALLVVALGSIALRTRPRVDQGRQRHALRRPGDRPDRGRGDARLAPAGASEPGPPLRNGRPLALAAARPRLPARAPLAHRPDDRHVRARRLHPHVHHVAGTHDRQRGRHGHQDMSRADTASSSPRAHRTQ